VADPRAFAQGLEARFAIPPQHADAVAARRDALPLELPDGTTPVLSRLTVLPFAPLPRPPPTVHAYVRLHPRALLSMQGMLLTALCSLQIGRGVTVLGAAVAFGAAADHVVLTLGAPDSVCYEADVPLLHMTESAAQLGTRIVFVASFSLLCVADGPWLPC
jgi:hypothetical protein